MTHGASDKKMGV